MLDLEVLLEASLNDEDIERTRKNAQAVLAERDRRFMKLFADYQLQKTHIARSIVDAKTAERRREEAEREAHRLASKVDRLEVLLLAAESASKYSTQQGGQTIRDKPCSPFYEGGFTNPLDEDAEKFEWVPDHAHEHTYSQSHENPQTACND